MKAGDRVQILKSNSSPIPKGEYGIIECETGGRERGCKVWIVSSQEHSGFWFFTTRMLKVVEDEQTTT